MKKELPEPKSAKDLIEEDLPLEHPEKAYRRGYRDAILVLGLDYDSLSKSKWTKIYNWALDGDLQKWQDKIRDEDDPGVELAPPFL